uniref:Uncharacterized protein n=1 Tax=uncultured Armatimonadetes bacterium TaxID=157466 RepID=A0A6J4I9G3_9BACT|nr:hypothetical protein AVDCRST_MAG63-1623 [uncultured Armatimonadetes bacterium]
MQERQHTDTEEALEENYGVEASLPYALRADQLADGTYRYALEDTQTGRVLVEAVHAEDHEALRRFQEALPQAGLNASEVAALKQAVRQYDRSSD